jgi:hypothetical protein
MSIGVIMNVKSSIALLLKAFINLGLKLGLELIHSNSSKAWTRSFLTSKFTLLCFGFGLKILIDVGLEHSSIPLEW